jgi:hypothetical protein
MYEYLLMVPETTADGWCLNHSGKSVPPPAKEIL